MALADEKKHATLIHHLAADIEVVRERLDNMELVNAKHTTANPAAKANGLTKAAIDAAITALRAAADDATWDLVIAQDVPSHRGEAL